MEISLDELENEVKSCRNCNLCQNRTNTVFGCGNKNAKIMFIGEGPGADEDREGLPFVGKAGKLMDMAFQGLGIKREEVYICNIVKCRPPNNRTPLKEEANACLNYLRIQVGVQCAEYKVTGLGSRDSGRNGLQIAHLTDENNVRVLPQSRPQTACEAVRVRADFALVDH